MSEQEEIGDNITFTFWVSIEHNKMITIMRNAVLSISLTFTLTMINQEWAWALLPHIHIYTQET